MFNTKQIIEDAINRKEAVGFVYRKADGKVSDRKIVPSQVVVSAKGELSVFGYDLGREGLRRFRIDRIVGEPVIEAKPEKGYDRDEYEGVEEVG